MIGIETKRNAKQAIEQNWTGEYTFPSDPHYRDLFRWDSAAAIIINASHGETEKAEIELKTLLEGMNQQTGFIPNRRIPGRKVDWNDLESLTFQNRRDGSSYTQPPLEAQAAWITYENLVAKGEKEKGIAFLQSVYGEIGQEKVSGLKGAYEYFARFRENGNGSRLVGIIHPNETGRDSDPSLKQGAVQIPGSKGIIFAANTALDVISSARINVRAKLRKWDPEKIRKEVYWVNDVMFNTLYVNNLLYMAQISSELGKDSEANEYKKLAKQVEDEIIEKMWNQDDGFFYNLDKNGNQIPITSISGLFPLLLPNIPKEQVEKLLETMEDPNKFGTKYPIPSIPADSPHYDPNYRMKRLWRGPLTMISNYLIAEEGLVKQIERFYEDKDFSGRLIKCLRNLVEKSEEIIETNGLREFNNPESGKGFRVRDFIWAILALHLIKSNRMLNLWEKNQEEIKIS